MMNHFWQSLFEWLCQILKAAPTGEVIEKSEVKEER